MQEINSVARESELFDIDRLAKAVAMHETKDCGLDYGASAKNNCFGIMSFTSGGQRYFKGYDSKEESYEDFKRIWSTWYGEMPTHTLAVKYSGNDRPDEWLANVTHFYHNL